MGARAGRFGSTTTVSSGEGMMDEAAAATERWTDGMFKNLADKILAHKYKPQASKMGHSQAYSSYQDPSYAHYIASKGRYPKEK